MSTKGKKTIARVRTFDDDVARIRGDSTPKEAAPEQKVSKAKKNASPQVKQATHTASDFISLTDEPVSNASKKEQPTNNQTQAKPLKPEEPKKAQKKESTLKKEVIQISAEDVPMFTEVSSSVHEISNNDFQEGTLITNKKNTRFRLLPAIVKSVKSWFGNTLQEVTRERNPEIKIAKAESRIETITAAAKASKHAPRDDHGVVIKKLTKTKRKRRSNKVIVKKRTEVAAPTWGSSNDADSSVEETEQISIPEKEKNALHHQIPSAPDKQVQDTSPAETIPVEIKNASTGKTLADTNTQMHLVNQESEKILNNGTSTPVNASVPEKESTKPIVKKKTYRATPSPVRKIPFYIYIVVLFGASLLGIGVSVYLFTNSNTTPTTQSIDIPALFHADIQIPVALSTQPKETLFKILEASVQNTQTTLVYPVVQNSEGQTIPADAQTVIANLELGMPGSFARSIKNISFGGYNGTTAFILMEATDFDTAFAGLLKWEEDISATFTPLFGIPVTQSFDSYARTDTQIRSAFFRDTVVGNKSTRTLVDVKNNERIVYGFITPTQILITPTSQTFIEILDIVKK